MVAGADNAPGDRARSQQDDKAFLCEMTVPCQDLDNAFLTHGCHRDAIGQAVFLVQACFVESQTSKEGLA